MDVDVKDDSMSLDNGEAQDGFETNEDVKITPADLKEEESKTEAYVDPHGIVQLYL